jgi:hypothetical protein
MYMHWLEQVETHCIPRGSTMTVAGTPAWDAAPTEQGLHNPQRLPQMLRDRGVVPVCCLCMLVPSLSWQTIVRFQCIESLCING